MFERYLTDALTTHFGHVLEGLDKDKIRLSAWKGELVLQDLSVKRHALDHWLPDAPVEIHYGHIGHLEVRIPWALVRAQLMRNADPRELRLHSSVLLSDVNILITPRRRRGSNTTKVVESNVSDSVEEDQTSAGEAFTDDTWIRKEKKAQAGLDAELLKRVAKSSQPTGRWQWLQERLANILSNLSVTVRNIHIRYEDSGSSMGFSWSWGDKRAIKYRDPFAMGIILREFSFQNDREREETANGESDGKDATFSIRRKVAAAQSLAMYWDSSSQIMAIEEEHDTPSDRKLFFETSFAVLDSDGQSVMRTLGLNGSPKAGTWSPHSFVLDPISPTVNCSLVARNVSAPVLVETVKCPYSEMQVALPPCHFTLSRGLLEDVGYLRKSLDVWLQSRKGIFSESTIRRLSRLRPLSTPREDAARWWKYAIEAVIVLEKINRDSHLQVVAKKRLRGWAGLMESLSYRKRYIALYEGLLAAANDDSRALIHSQLSSLERELLTSEIVAFRIASYYAIRRFCKSGQSVADLLKVNKGWQAICASESITNDFGAFPDGKVLTLRYRCEVFFEMAVALDRISHNTEERENEGTEGADTTVQIQQALRSVITWRTSMGCPEFSLQVNDKKERSNHFFRSAPVVRLSCSWSQEQFLYRCGSWDVTNRIGSLVVKDCTAEDQWRRIEPRNRVLFPNLVGPKEFSGERNMEDMFEVEGRRVHQSAWIRIRRTPHWEEGKEVGSTTITEVRVLPLEVAYATDPVEALSRILASSNLDVADDYHRIAGKLYTWRKRQQERLIKALAHKGKKIIVDVDFGAPVFLIPEASQRNCPMLIFDLGRLRFSNEDMSTDSQREYYDDLWRLELDNIQVQCSSTSTYRQGQLSSIDQGSATQQIVEPFTLAFAISTKVEVEDDRSSGDTKVKIIATLPRLAINLSSSAVHLIKRLQHQWSTRKEELRSVVERSRSLILAPSHNRDFEDRSIEEQSVVRHKAQGGENRMVEFHFSAPLLSFHFVDDVTLANRGLVDLGLRGVEGKVLREESSFGTARLICTAKVGTLYAVDLHQEAGDEFSLLLSSVAPELVQGLQRGFESRVSGTDLVTFRFVSEKSKTETSDDTTDRLEVEFNELYVEWNPDTLAAIHRATELPSIQIIENEIPEDESFYDAEEEDFYDAESTASDFDSESHIISEISSSQKSSASDLPTVAQIQPLSPTSPFVSPTMGMYSSPKFVSYGSMVIAAENNSGSSGVLRKERRPFETIFKLSKLRVSFNKESRCRKLFAAEMDSTTVTFRSNGGRGSQMEWTMGNLTFSDSDFSRNGTLYRDILGLKTDDVNPAGAPSSLLHMVIVMKPKSRVFTSLESNGTIHDQQDSVLVDQARGAARGFDTRIKAKLSPMRFVYLQQLWFEIVDYFFEGIVGFEVWGKKRPSPLTEAQVASCSDDARQVTFTLFDIEMESPVILFPVSYCSTDFLRLAACKITLSNKYDCRPMRDRSPSENSDLARRQWFNNCTVCIQEMKLSNWSRRSLHEHADSYPNAEIRLDWPTGPSASLNAPKWRVRTSIDAFYLALNREDYALLQHIIQCNIGEASRHLDEWNALKTLPRSALDKFLTCVMVHYGYDKKDVTPTTFDVTITLPILQFLFRGADDITVSVVSCSNLTWSYKKVSDLVSHQGISCDVDIIGNAQGSRVPLLSAVTASTASARGERLRTLVYTSTTQPWGDNSKRLEIGSARIRLVYAAWFEFSKFFQDLPAASFLSPDSVIQVGDRWYKIGHSGQANATVRAGNDLSWIERIHCNAEDQVTEAPEQSVHRERDPSFEFKFMLSRPSVVLESDHSSLSLSMDSISILHSGKSGQISRHFELLGITLRTGTIGRSGSDDDLSLIDPWNLVGSLRRCSGRQKCFCQTHYLAFQANVLSARAAYSDINVAGDVVKTLFNDIQSLSSRSVTSKTPNQPKAKYQEMGDLQIMDGKRIDDFSLNMDGLKFTVIDDSGRHFAGSQELFVLSILVIDISGKKWLQTTSQGTEVSFLKSSAQVVLRTVDIDDCLQSISSPFRPVLCIRGRKSVVNPENSKEKVLLPGDTQTWALILSYDVLKSKKELHVNFGSVSLQYNPSMVIAFQRLLGRLKKDMKKKMGNSLEGPVEKLAQSATDQSERILGSFDTKELLTIVEVKVDDLCVCLNKEHQGRRLLESTLRHCRMRVEQSHSFVVVEGYVRVLQADDTGVSRREKHPFRKFISTQNDTHNFFEFSYRRFSNGNPPNINKIGCVPVWVLERAGYDGIDDILQVSFATASITIFRDRLEELVDYLGNGMPGKGMGATSRAAKGFVKDRIATKSFFDMQINAPLVYIPLGETSTSTVALRLGDLAFQSWIEDHDCSETKRMGTITLTGLSCEISQEGKESAQSLLRDLSLCIRVMRSDSVLSVACELSEINLRLVYSEYRTFLLILRGNITKKVDRSKWDNLEVAWEAETEIPSPRLSDRSGFSNEVTYSDSARYVRFGQTERSRTLKPHIDFHLAFDCFSLILAGSDDSCETDFSNDFLVFKGFGFDVSFSSKSDGDKSLNVTLDRIFVFDIGTPPEDQHDSRHNVVRSVSVIVAGYSPSEAEDDLSASETAAAQLVFKIDRVEASGGETRVILILSRLSALALTRPIYGAISFFRCKWSSESGEDAHSDTESIDGNAGEIILENQGGHHEREAVQVRVVLHYPRIIFVADEQDVHSRALVLQGLAIVNADYCNDETSDTDLKVSADLQRVSSYINPDIFEVRCIRSEHFHMLEHYLHLSDDSELLSADDMASELGVQLLLPLTVGVEYEQQTSGSMTNRSLSVNVDPVSLMISNDDLQLLRSLTNRFSSVDKSNRKVTFVYDVTFHKERLGLGLKKERGLIVVDNIGDKKLFDLVRIGDTIAAINGESVQTLEHTGLAEIVNKLSSVARPLTISFVREELRLSADDREADGMTNDAICRAKNYSVDVSLSEAIVTVIESEVPILKGRLLEAKVGGSLSRKDGSTEVGMKFASIVAVDYYNVRIWGWEPVLEPGGFAVAVDYVNPRDGPRAAALEFTDNGKFLCLNVTDSLAEAVARFKRLSGANENSIEDVILLNPSDLLSSGVQAGEVTKTAANVALAFAKRQKNDLAKPFIFRNRSGISVAFTRRRDNTRSNKKDDHFPAVGEYHGLEKRTDSEVVVVLNNEERKFRVHLGARVRDSEISRRHAERAQLTVAFQVVGGVTAEPLIDLPTTQPGVLSFPLRIVPGIETVKHEKKWVVWEVDHKDETTTLTLASGMRIVSMLEEKVEVFVYQVDRDDKSKVTKSIGYVLPGEPLYVPLWMIMEGGKWCCCAKLKGHLSSPLFEFSPRGITDPGRRSRDVMCVPESQDVSTKWLAISIEESDGLTSIIVDCAVTIRNLLPAVVHVEARSAEETASASEACDFFFQPVSFVVGPGKRCDVLSERYDTIKIRLRVQELKWTNWFPLQMPSAAEVKSTISSFRSIQMWDDSGVPLVLGAKISQKLGGCHVSLFADLWCSNSTSLPLVFGQAREIGRDDVENSEGESENVELSAAEAALKEISSLFEPGQDGRELRKTRLGTRRDSDLVRIPFQSVQQIVEECFEYLEIESSTVKRRWWASEDPSCTIESIKLVEAQGAAFIWVDPDWTVDRLGKTSDEGWESSSNLYDFTAERIFNPTHRYRRRRWTRKRQGEARGAMIEGIHAFYQPSINLCDREEVRNPIAEGIRLGVQVGGGKWALTSTIPLQGAVYGALRAVAARWPAISQTVGVTPSSHYGVFELCYSVVPLPEPWGEFSRSLVVSSRFLLRNDSKSFIFEVKQIGARDEFAIRVLPGQTSVPFHWADFHLPELICLRPVDNLGPSTHYKWSGGFDPLTIGVIPLRVRQRANSPDEKHQLSRQIRSVKVEIEIRSKTGGTGINLSFIEEDSLGQGALFRIENMSPFPIWIAQDGVLSNPFAQQGEGKVTTDGDLLRQGEMMCHSLDVPFRQGKYKTRQAASMEELLRTRMSLAPLSSRPGIETTKVISFISVGEQIRLNPGRLSILSSDTRSTLMYVRVFGMVATDGPTRVIRLRLIEKDPLDNVLSNLFRDVSSSMSMQDALRSTPYTREIVRASQITLDLLREGHFPRQADVESFMINPYDNSQPAYKEECGESTPTDSDLVVSLRASFSGIVISLVDSAPSEIAVGTFRNINALATFDSRRTKDSTIYLTMTDVQVDNMLPNAPFPVAISPDEQTRESLADGGANPDDLAPVLVVGLSIAPRHRSGIVCLKSATIAPRHLAIRVDLAFLVRLQKFALDLQSHFENETTQISDTLQAPDILARLKELSSASASNSNRQKFYFGGLTILPCSIKLSVAPARALTPSQAALEGQEAASIHQAVRKGDVRLESNSKALFGVKLGSRNKTPMAVVRGVFKSIVVDALLRLDGASLNFQGICLRNHVSTWPQLSTHLGAHYMASMRQNVPALVGSMAAFGNPLGLVRGLGDGVSDFVLEPVRGFQRSVQEMDATHLVDGVTRGTLSLARHTVGGFADSAAMLTETFSKNMAVLTLDRKYAQRRDRGEALRSHDDVNVALGLGSGVQKLVTGFLEGVTGVVRQPIRGAEKRGFEGFAKGIGKGLLGLLVKPIIGISDGLTDVMIGVKGSVEGASGYHGTTLNQIRPRRALYGKDKALRTYNLADAAATALMLRTRLAGEVYFSHVDMGDRVALLSVKRLLLLGARGEELLVLKWKHVASLELRPIEQSDGSPGWGIIILLNTPRRNGSELEVVVVKSENQAKELLSEMEKALHQGGSDIPAQNAGNDM